MSIQIFEEYFALFGVPRQLIIDRGTSLTSNEFNQFVVGKGMKHILNTVATPLANGQIERYNKTLVESLASANHGHSENEWDTVLFKVQWSLNNTINKGFGKTPAETLFGVVTTGSCDDVINNVVAESQQLKNRDEIRNEVEQRISSEQLKQKDRYDKTRKEATQYKILRILFV
ncbi:unnamed protein product [Parnassius mnemosyne]|uniref:Integrase catalytic domain-containing protein n=1 Tax=Parnassius mnemosyne TaxID=213953 RepID=A0AAV1LTA1_9NEOP